MALQWQDSPTMSVSVAINTNEDGFLATGSDTAAGTRTFSLSGIKADATYPQAQTVLNAFIGGIASGTYVATSAVRTIKSGVVESE